MLGSDLGQNLHVLLQTSIILNSIQLGIGTLFLNISLSSTITVLLFILILIALTCFFVLFFSLIFFLMYIMYI